ncbi:MAG: Rrf2 family transcriptional regulator [Bryobacteraceae bacterium]
MFTKTAMSALRALIYLASRREPFAIESHRRIAEQLGESPTYMAKVAGLLVKAAILHAEKGVNGGVRLSRPANEITLLDVIESCQGAVVGDYCRPGRDPQTTCGFHHAAEELHHAVTGVLRKWTVARVMTPPKKGMRPGGLPCMVFANGRDGARPGVPLQIGGTVS